MSTYALDCNEQRRVYIRRQTNEQLDRAVEAAVEKFGDDFWVLLYGVDAYMERRRRRGMRVQERATGRRSDLLSLLRQSAGAMTLQSPEDEQMLEWSRQS